MAYFLAGDSSNAQKRGEMEDDIGKYPLSSWIMGSFINILHAFEMRINM